MENTKIMILTLLTVAAIAAWLLLFVFFWMQWFGPMAANGLALATFVVIGLAWSVVEDIR